MVCVYNVNLQFNNLLKVFFSDARRSNTTVVVRLSLFMTLLILMDLQKAHPLG